MNIVYLNVPDPSGADPELRFPDKDPADVIVQQVDATVLLASLGSIGGAPGPDTIASVSSIAITPSDMTVTQAEHTASTMTWQFAGGTITSPLTDYSIVIQFTTTLGNTIRRTIFQRLLSLNPNQSVGLNAVAVVVGPQGIPGPPGTVDVPSITGSVTTSLEANSAFIAAVNATSLAAINTETANRVAGDSATLASAEAFTTSTVGTLATTSSVSSLAGTVASTASTVSSLSTTVTNNTAALSSLSGSVTSNAAAINAESLRAISSEAILSAGMTALSGTVTAQGGTITTLIASVAAQSGSLTGINATLASNTASISTLSAAQVSQSATLTGLAGTVAGQSTTIIALSAGQTSQSGSITANASAITAETARAMSSESSLAGSIAAIGSGYDFATYFSTSISQGPSPPGTSGTVWNNRGVLSLTPGTLTAGQPVVHSVGGGGTFDFATYAVGLSTTKPSAGPWNNGGIISNA